MEKPCTLLLTSADTRVLYTVRWYTCRPYSVLPASYRTMITDVWHARIKTSGVCAGQHSIVCRSQCNLKCNLSYRSHRKYVLKAIMICVIEEEFGPTRDQETGHWMRLHSEEFLICTAWAIKVKNVHTGFWWGDLKKRDHFEDLFLDGTIILKRMFKK
jgi:hypothetical protein